jgi:hypothetical protein
MVWIIIYMVIIIKEFNWTITHEARNRLMFFNIDWQNKKLKYERKSTNP